MRRRVTELVLAAFVAGLIVLLWAFVLWCIDP